MKKYNRKYRVIEEEENFWPSFTDMISTIALILFFLMILTYVNKIVSDKNLEFAKEQLQDTELHLEESKAEISQAENQLRLLKMELEKTAAEVEDGQIALQLSEEEINKQREIIAASNAELGDLRSKLKGVALLRLEVLTSVKDSIESTIGKKSSSGEDLVSIADNGNIIINEGLVFEFDSATLKPEGKKLLASFAKAFELVLSESETRKNIDAINIQGHTDTRGSSEYNRNLSNERAAAVVNYMMNSNPSLENKYGKYFLAGGYSEFRPIDNGTTEKSYSKNRRIEISVILKDSNIQNLLDDYLSEILEKENVSINSENEVIRN
jgi:chemotaxis protein MotB